MRLTRIENPGDHAGEDDDEEREKLEAAAQDAAGLGVRVALAGQRALNNHLVEQATGACRYVHDDLVLYRCMYGMFKAIQRLRTESEPYLVGAPVPHRVQGQANDARPRDVSSHRITHQAKVVVTWIAASVV